MVERSEYHRSVCVANFVVTKLQYVRKLKAVRSCRHCSCLWAEVRNFLGEILIKFENPVVVKSCIKFIVEILQPNNVDVEL